MGKQNRVEWIDLVRCIAIITVVLCHSTEGIYRLNVDFIQKISTQSKFFGFSMFTVGRLGVPLFLMITGYLFLDRDYSKEYTFRFWKNNWLRLLVCTQIWILIYDVFLMLYSKTELKIITIIQDMLFIHQVNISHIWYMPMILGMYILIPFVGMSLKGIDINTLKFPFAFFSLYAFGFPLLNVINSVLENEPLRLTMSFGFSGGAYGIYILTGYLMKKGLLKKYNMGILVIVCLISFCCAVGIQLWAYSNYYTYNIWYDSPFLLITATIVFEILSRIQKIKMYPVIKLISKYSFAIYLIHFMIRIICAEYLKLISINLPLKVISLWIITFVLTLICAWVISKIPVIGKYLLNIK